MPDLRAGKLAPALPNSKTVREVTLNALLFCLVRQMNVSNVASTVPTVQFVVRDAVFANEGRANTFIGDDRMNRPVNISEMTRFIIPSE
jgi:hypothetical protein